MKFYDNIYDLPISKYHRVIEDGDLKHLYKESVEKVEKEAVEAWEKINCQIIDNFGLSAEAELIFYKQNTVNKIELQLILGDRTNETTCEVLKREIENLKKNQKEIKDIRRHHARLHRILQERYQRDTHNLSTFEFFNDLIDLQKEQNEKKLQIRKYA